MEKINLRRNRSLGFTTAKKPLAAAKRFTTANSIAHRDEEEVG